MKYLLSFFLLIIGMNNYVFAQQHVFTNMNSAISLPSQECYNIMQDRKGYIWIGTELGLCRYNGTDLKIFDKNNNLPEGAVYSILEDKQGQMWFATSKNRILNYTNGRLRENILSKKYQQSIGNLHVTYSLKQDHEGIYLNSERLTYRLSTGDKQLINLTKKQNGKEIHFDEKTDQLIPINYHYDQFNSILPVVINTHHAKKILKIPVQVTNSYNWRILTCKISDSHFVSFNKTLIKINADYSYTVIQMPSPIISLYADKTGSLWVGTLRKGVHYYERADLSQKPLISLNEYSVSGICEDNEKNIWCTTLERGIFFSQSKKIINYANIPNLTKPVNFLKNINETIFISPYNLSLISLNENQKVKYYPNISNKHNITDIINIVTHFILSGDTGALVTKKKLTGIKNSDHNYIYDLTKATDNSVYFISYNSITKIQNNVGKVILKLKSPGRNIAYIDSNTIIYSCFDGLYRLDLKTNRSQKFKGMDYPITKIYKTKANEILITTRGWGFFQLKDNKLIKLNKKFNILTEVYFDLTEDRFGSLWIASNIGLIKINSTNRKTSTDIYTSLNGLPANEVYKVVTNKDKVFLSTSEGLSSFPLSENLKNNTPPNLFINSLKVNGKAVKFNNRLNLPYYQNSLQLTFDILSFKNNEISLYYKLKSTDKSYLINKGNKLILENLKPAAYELMVYGMNSDGIKSTEPIIISIEIDNPFWQKIWFIIFCLLSIALLVYLLIKKITKRIKIKEIEKTRIGLLIAESKLTALQAQMNPHFVFNAINSIQNYILKKQEKDAYNYLAKFSKLIRSVLHNSQQKTITLDEELETLNLYIELERMRFDNSFEFQLYIHPSIDNYAIQIPTMLMQPYIENAIWHGLMNLANEREGLLRISISENEKTLCITIEDNGVGRVRSLNYKLANGHQPVGMKLNEQRIATLNEMFGKDSFSIEIVDLYNENKHAIGTRVSIALPIIN